MRLKLSFTVEEEDVNVETSKILGMAADDVQHSIRMFQEIQKELVAPEGETNLTTVFEMIGDMRRALAKVDVRAVEVEEILRSYNDYVNEKDDQQTLAAANLENLPQPPVALEPELPSDTEALED